MTHLYEIIPTKILWRLRPICVFGVEGGRLFYVGRPFVTAAKEHNISKQKLIFLHIPPFWLGLICELPQWLPFLQLSLSGFFFEGEILLHVKLPVRNDFRVHGYIFWSCPDDKIYSVNGMGRGFGHYPISLYCILSYCLHAIFFACPAIALSLREATKEEQLDQDAASSESKAETAVTLLPLPVSTRVWLWDLVWDTTCNPIHDPSSCLVGWGRGEY